jgi:hypothetical protein
MYLPGNIYYLLVTPIFHYRFICFEAHFHRVNSPKEIEDMRKALIAALVAFGVTFSAPAFAGGSHHGGGGPKVGAGLKLGVGVKGLVKAKVGLGVGIGL